MNCSQKYRLSYPEKNIVWMNPNPDKCFTQRIKECNQISQFTPTPCSQCRSTFMPWDKPHPQECIKKCKGIDVNKVDACLYSQTLFKKRPCNGQLMEPSIAHYTNISLDNGYRSTSTLTSKYRNPPPPPEYGYKGSAAYNPVEWICGKSYFF